MLFCIKMWIKTGEIKLRQNRIHLRHNLIAPVLLLHHLFYRALGINCAKITCTNIHFILTYILILYIISCTWSSSPASIILHDASVKTLVEQDFLVFRRFYCLMKFVILDYDNRLSSVRFYLQTSLTTLSIINLLYWHGNIYK